MRPDVPSEEFRIDLDTKHCSLSEDEIEHMRASLAPLERVIENFPVRDLFVTVIHHARSGDYHVKTSLALPSRTLFTGDRDEAVHPAYERCVRKLIRKVEAYKRSMDREEEWSKREKRTRQEVEASHEVDVQALAAAVEAADYSAFRDALDAYEESLRKRVGRWIERYPDIETLIGESLTIADVVDEVFLTAFEQFEHRPQNVPPAEWLTHLVDPAIKALAKRPDEELENIDFARTYEEMQHEEGES